MKKKTVYVPLAVDILHEGHINILNIANRYGDVVVGLLTDKAISEYKNLPLFSFDERHRIVKNIKIVKKIVRQDFLGFFKYIKFS